MSSLPIEIIEKIMSYHQVKDLEVLKLVCRNNFYYAASRALSFKTLLRVTKENLIDDSMYEAIMKTSRQFKDLKLIIEYYGWRPEKKLFDLLRKFGSTIETLEIQHHLYVIRLSTLIEIFRNLKGLKYIKIERRCRIENDFPLSQLPQLNLSHEAIGIIEIASKLNFLPVLELIPNEDESLIGWTLQHVQFDEIFEVDSAFFRNLKINKLSNVCEDDGYEQTNENFLSKLIATQNLIDELDLVSYYYRLGSNLLLNISNNTLLRKLNLKALCESGVDMHALNKLINLEELSIEIADSNVQTFMNVSLPSLKVLKMHGCWPIIDEGMLGEMMSANWPNLQEFEGTLTGGYKLNLKLFLDALPELTSLIIKRSPMQSFQLQNGHYPSIRKLHFDKNESRQKLLLMPPKFIKAFPNLNDLLCDGDVIVNRASMHAILNSKIQKIKLNINLHQSDLSEIERLMEQIEAKMDSRIKITLVGKTQLPIKYKFNSSL